MSRDIQISKTLSFWLRHDPGAADLSLDPAGWVDVDAVLAALARSPLACGWEDLVRVVETNDKQRFELSADASRIRARQGHSVSVDLGWPEAEPPAVLFHGTVESFLEAIMAEGLRPMSRHHVHLSPDRATALRVGARRGRPIILEIAAGALRARGQSFYLTGNGVWLTDLVPPEFLARSTD